MRILIIGTLFLSSAFGCATLSRDQLVSKANGRKEVTTFPIVESDTFYAVIRCEKLIEQLNEKIEKLETSLAAEGK